MSDQTLPSDAGPSDAVPSDAVPSDAVPSDAGPSNAGPSDAATPTHGEHEVLHVDWHDESDAPAEQLAAAPEPPRGAVIDANRPGAGPAGRSGRDREREDALLRELASLPEDDPRRAAIRDEIVTMHLPMAAFLARRFRDRGESQDDLVQVATIGLIKAADRFDPDRGVAFSTFATPTVLGEIRRHFRDKGWAIRVPRRLQELRAQITRAIEEISQSTGHTPTVAELAAHLGVTEDAILEGLESAQAYTALSLDIAAHESDDGTSLADTLGEEDGQLAEVEARATVNPLLASLPPRERTIVQMRFYENLTQAQIAERMGMSQMHVSRLLARSLAEMRQLAEHPAYGPD